MRPRRRRHGFADRQFEITTSVLKTVETALLCDLGIEGLVHRVANWHHAKQIVSKGRVAAGVESQPAKYPAVRAQIDAGAMSQDLLETLEIITNRNPIPFDPAPAHIGSGLSLGSPAMTTRGLSKLEFRQISNLIAHMLGNHVPTTVLPEAPKKVGELVLDYPLFAKKWLPKRAHNHAIN